MIPLEQFQIAKKNMDDMHVLNSSKLIHMPFLSEREENTVYIKPELLQKIGAYKIRGAFNFIFNLSEEERKIGVIAASAGNHAQGVALSAKMLGVKAIIVMPKTTPLIKVENVKKYGAEVDKNDAWGEKALAYEIAGCKRGCYYLTSFGLRERKIKQIHQEVNYIEDLLRVMIIVKDR